VLTFPLSNDTAQGSTSIVLDNVAFSSVNNPVVDSSGSKLLTGSGGFQVDIWAAGTQYAAGDAWQNVSTSQEDDLGGLEFSYGANLQANRVHSLELAPDSPTGGFGSTWYSYQTKPQYQDTAVTDFLNVKDVGAKGKSRMKLFPLGSILTQI